jgi:hypothetical protein
MGAAELTQYLSALAVQGNVAASTQNQALTGFRCSTRRKTCLSARRLRRFSSACITPPLRRLA